MMFMFVSAINGKGKLLFFSEFCVRFYRVGAKRLQRHNYYFLKNNAHLLNCRLQLYIQGYHLLDKNTIQWFSGHRVWADGISFFDLFLQKYGALSPTLKWVVCPTNFFSVGLPCRFNRRFFSYYFFYCLFFYCQLLTSFLSLPPAF